MATMSVSEFKEYLNRQLLNSGSGTDPFLTMLEWINEVAGTQQKKRAEIMDDFMASWRAKDRSVWNSYQSSNAARAVGSLIDKDASSGADRALRSTASRNSGSAASTRKYGYDNVASGTSSSSTTKPPGTSSPDAAVPGGTNPSGGGGGGSTYSGGGSSSSGGGDVSTDGTGPSDRLPGGYEVWKIDGELHLIYQLPGSNIPMAWRVDGKPEAILGSFSVSKTLSGRDAAKRGVLVMGRHSDLKNSEKDPFDNFLDTIEERSVTEPWLKDPEVIVQSAEAYLEGRDVTIGDLKETEWFNSKTDKERQWIATAAQSSDAELERLKDDARIQTRDLLLRAGVSNPPAQLVDFLANANITGRFTDAQFVQQITAIADPYSGITMDPEVKKALKGIDLVTKASDVRDMKQRVKDWIGPFADSYTDRQLEEWAGMLRNDPNGEAKLEDILRGQRMALMPEYANPDIKWSDAAAPWKSYLSQQWGEPVSDDDPLLLQVVRANDINAAGTLARKEGMRRGVGGAVNQVTEALTSAFGGSVQRSL